MRAKEKVQTGLFCGEWTGCHSELPASSGQEGLAPVCAKIAGPILLSGLVGFFGGLNHSHPIPDGTQNGLGQAGRARRSATPRGE